jgi:hypothetical protein
MKTFYKIILGSFVLAGLFGLGGCVGGGGDVEADTGVYYGGPYFGDPWFHDGPWVDGHGWYGEPRGGGHAGAYIHPPRVGGGGHSGSGTRRR